LIQIRLKNKKITQTNEYSHNIKNNGDFGRFNFFLGDKERGENLSSKKTHPVIPFFKKKDIKDI